MLAGFLHLGQGPGCASISFFLGTNTSHLLAFGHVCNSFLNWGLQLLDFLGKYNIRITFLCVRGDNLSTVQEHTLHSDGLNCGHVLVHILL